MAASEALPADARVLRVHGPSRLAFAGTTLALVTLATLATAALVNESTSVAPGSVAPGLEALPPLVTGGGHGVVVDRAPGTFTLTPPRTAVPPTVIAALVGGSQGSSSLPPVVGSGSGFPVIGVLRGTTGTPVPAPLPVPVPVPAPVPVTAPVPVPVPVPVDRPGPKPPVVHVPSVTPDRVVRETERLVERAVKAAERAHKKAERKAEHDAAKAAHTKNTKNTKHAKHERAAHRAKGSDEEQQQIEDRRFHEQAKHQHSQHS